VYPLLTGTKGDNSRTEVSVQCSTGMLDANLEENLVSNKRISNRDCEEIGKESSLSHNLYTADSFK
jgi:hypothetical protein